MSSYCKYHRGFPVKARLANGPLLVAEAGHKPGESIVCTGKIKHVGSTYIDQWNYLKNLMPEGRAGEAKLTLPAPEWYHLRYQPGRAYAKGVYANDAEYFADIAKAYRAELQTLYDAGCRNITIDDPNLACKWLTLKSSKSLLISLHGGANLLQPLLDFCSEKMLAGFREAGEDADALLDNYVALYNDCLSARPADLHVGIHLCRGNFAYSRHFSEGGYDRVAVKLFREINVDTYFLEYDTERAGGFEPLEQLPPHKNVIVGVITSKFPELEDPEKMRERVFQAADFVARGAGQTREQALQRMGVSPQCGFASHHLGNSVTREDMMAKLKLVRQIADSIWPGQP